VSAPTPVEILSALVRLLDGDEARKAEAAAKRRLADYRDQFRAEYRALACEVRVRGSEPRTTEDEYVALRFAQVLP
jgi:hypothetical protein